MPAIPSRSSSLRAAVAPLSIILVAWVAANSMNYVTPLRPGPDAGEYASGGMMLGEGRVLYRDIMEVKPPMIYALNALALRIGDGTFHSVRVLERVFAVAGALIVFFLVLILFEKPSLAVLAAIALSFYCYSDGVLEQGNVTEEYAVVFVLAGMLCTVRAVVRATPPSVLFSALAGLCFSCAVLTKEPFLFSSLPWFLWLVLAPRTEWRPAAGRGAAFVLGALVPVLVFLGYLILNDGLLAWLDKLTASLNYVAVSREQRSFLATLEPMRAMLYSRVLLATKTGALALGAGILAALAFPVFLRKHRYVPLPALLAFLAEFLGAALSGRAYGHYLLQIMPSFILCCAIGGALLIYACDRVLVSKGTSVLLLFLVPCLLDGPVVVDYWHRLNQPFVRSKTDALSTYVAAHASPTDHLWVSSAHNSRFYIETGLTSPTGFHHFEPIWFTDSWRTTGAEKLARLRSELARGAPEWIVVANDAPSLAPTGVLDWICANYVRAPVLGQGNDSVAYLYVTGDRAAALLGPAERVGDTECARMHVRVSLQMYNQGEWRKSIESSIKVLSLDPNSAVARSNICAAHIQLKEYDKAIDACESALAIDSSFQLAKNNLSWAQAEKARQ